MVASYENFKAHQSEQFIISHNRNSYGEFQSWLIRQLKDAIKDPSSPTLPPSVSASPLGGGSSQSQASLSDPKPEEKESLPFSVVSFERKHFPEALHQTLSHISF